MGTSGWGFVRKKAEIKSKKETNENLRANVKKMKLHFNDYFKDQLKIRLLEILFTRLVYD